MVRFVQSRRRAFVEIGAMLILGAVPSFGHGPELAVGLAALGAVLILAAG